MIAALNLVECPVDGRQRDSLSVRRNRYDLQCGGGIFGNFLAAKLRANAQNGLFRGNRNRCAPFDCSATTFAHADGYLGFEQGSRRGQGRKNRFKAAVTVFVSRVDVEGYGDSVNFLV